MEINREDERPHVVMMAKDKDDINKFATKLARRNELHRRIAGRKKLIQVHDDAADELIIMDDDAEIFYNFGDVFLMDEKTQIEATLDKTKERLAKELSDYEQQVEKLEKEMISLKASLYAKFGKVCFSIISFCSFLLFSVARRLTVFHLCNHTNNICCMSSPLISTPRNSFCAMPRLSTWKNDVA